MWKNLNCPLNDKLEKCDSEILLSNQIPEALKIPDNIKIEIYEENNDIPYDKIIQFINENDKLSGNITLIDKEKIDRLLKNNSYFGVVFNKENEIIGTMCSISISLKYNDEKINSSYTTYLCIHPDYRNKNLAMLLISSIINKGARILNVNHGYYIVDNKIHNINNTIQTWYRIINYKKAKNANYTMYKFPGKIREKLYYHISDAPIDQLINPTVENYEKFLSFLDSKDKLTFYPSSYKYFKNICITFDIYMNDKGFFMLFPIDSLILNNVSKNILMNNVFLVLMIGDLFNELLYISKKYDVIYGKTFGNLNEELIIKNKCLKTKNKILEFYNQKEIINLDKIFIPII